MPYRGWIKVSPWKRSNVDEWSGDARRSSCAKTFFITKPKSIQASEMKEQVSVILNKLNHGEYRTNITRGEEGRTKEWKCRRWVRGKEYGEW